MVIIFVLEGSADLLWKECKVKADLYKVTLHILVIIVAVAFQIDDHIVSLASERG